MDVQMTIAIVSAIVLVLASDAWGVLSGASLALAVHTLLTYLTGGVYIWLQY